jgi:hypothetical protein
LPAARIDPTAISLLQEFKNEMRGQGLYESFIAPEELESKLYHNLDVKIDELLAGRLPVPKTIEEKAEPLSWCRVDHPDSRLSAPVDFGTNFSEIATSIAERVNHCVDIGGASNDNFLDLGGRIFQSAAHALAELLDKRPYEVPVASRNPLDRATDGLLSAAEQRQAIAWDASPRKKMPIIIKSRSDGRCVCRASPVAASRLLMSYSSVFLGLASQAITCRHFVTETMWAKTSPGDPCDKTRNCSWTGA